MKTDEVLGFGMMLTIAAVAVAAIGPQMLAGFAVGVLTTLAAVAIVSADFY